jgi:type II secretion system protein N
MERKIIRIPVYIAFGLASFLIAMAVTFPDQRVKEIAVVQLESQLGNAYDVSVEDLDLWWLTGVALEGITISERAEPSDEGGDEDDGSEKAGEKAGEAQAASAGPESKPLQVKIPQVAAKFAPLSSLFNLAPTVDFSVDLGGGDVDGAYIHGSDAREVEVSIDELNLKETELVSEFLGLPVFGELDGDINIVLDPKRPLVTGGSVELNGKQLTVGPGTITSKKFGAMGFIDVPQTSFGTLEADLNIRQTKGGNDTDLTFDKLSLKGRDIRGEVWGKIDLGRGMRGSRAKLEMRFQFNDQFIKKNNLQSVLNIKWLREGKSKDWYGFVLWGSLAKPNFKGAPTAAKGPPEGGGGGPGTGPPAAENPGPSGEN